MWWRCVLQFRQDLAHPCHVGGLPRLGALDHDDSGLLVLVFLPRPLFDVCNLLWDELGYRLPVLLVCALVELLLVGKEKLLPFPVVILACLKVQLALLDETLLELFSFKDDLAPQLLLVLLLFLQKECILTAPLAEEDAVVGPHLGGVGEDGAGVGEEAVVVLVVHAVAVGVGHAEGVRGGGVVAKGVGVGGGQEVVATAPEDMDVVRTGGGSIRDGDEGARVSKAVTMASRSGARGDGEGSDMFFRVEVSASGKMERDVGAWVRVWVGRGLSLDREHQTRPLAR